MEIQMSTQLANYKELQLIMFGKGMFFPLGIKGVATLIGHLL